MYWILLSYFKIIGRIESKNEYAKEAYMYVYYIWCAYFLRLKMIRLPAKPWLGRKIVISMFNRIKKNGNIKIWSVMSFRAISFCKRLSKYLWRILLIPICMPIFDSGSWPFLRLRIIVLSKFPYHYNVKPFDQS